MHRQPPGGMVLLGLLALASLSSANTEPPRKDDQIDGKSAFRDVRIDRRYRDYLLAQPVLMETGGATVIRLKNRLRMVIGVGSVGLADDRPKTLLDAHRVAELKALVSIEKQDRGVQIMTEESVRDRTVLTLENGKESGRSVSEILSVTTARLKGIMGKGMSPVGTWRSSDGKTFFLALGTILDAGGEVVNPGVGMAAQRAGIRTPQVVTLHFTTGRTYRGTLLAVDDRQVRFQLRPDTGAGLFQVAQLRAIQTASDLFTFDQATRTWQSGSRATDQSNKGSNPAGQKDRALPARTMGGTATVIAEGAGQDREEALRAAFRSAIRQVVGALVDTETLVRDDRVIADRVLTYSDGVIRTYTTISEERTRGLWLVRISAVVVRRGVVARLQAAGVRMKGVQGKDLVAEVLTRREAQAGATNLIQKAFAELPRLLVAEVVKPTARDYDEDRQELKVTILIRPDLGQYELFSRRIGSLMNRLSLAKEGVLLEARPYLMGLARTRGRAGFLDQVLAEDDQKSWFVWVLTAADGRWARQRWQGYRVDGDRQRCLAGLRGTWAIQLSLLDGQGKVISEEEVAIAEAPGGKEVLIPSSPVTPSRPSWANQPISPPRSSWATRFPAAPGGKKAPVGRAGAGRHWLVTETRRGGKNPTGHVLLAPLQMGVTEDLAMVGSGKDRRLGRVGVVVFRPAQIVLHTLKLSESELKRLKNIHCKVVFRPAGGDD